MFRVKNYVKVESLEEAWELNQKRSNVVLGGFLWLKMGDRNKQTAIDLSGLGLNEIEESKEAFSIGAMCTLRELELHKGMNSYFGTVIKEAVRHIVGVQFRNCATVGGSIFGRFGFSDVLTCFLALDTYVELYKGGVITLEEFVNKPKDNDILVRIIIKKDGRKAAYLSERQTKTDFPMIACGVSKKGSEWFISVGARPYRARLFTTVWEQPQLLAEAETLELVEAFAKKAAGEFDYGSNLRGSGAYRAHLAEVCIKRCILQLPGGEV